VRACASTQSTLYSTHRALRMTVGFFVPVPVPPPPWADWSPPGPSWSSITPISASGSLREASTARMDGCLWMLGYGWVQDGAMAAGLDLGGETTEGLGDNADCRREMGEAHSVAYSVAHSVRPSNTAAKWVAK
jgi:hypothetical protein